MIVREVVKEIGGLTMRTAPMKSSQSQGSIERFHQTMFSQIRTMRSALASRLGMEIKDIQITAPVMTWLVKHAVWLLNRYLVHDDGLSSYQRRF